MFCANCGDKTTDGNDLCSACQQEQMPQLATELALVAAGNATTDTAQPGWYVDPLDSNQQRYWDGTTWAADTAPYAALLEVKGVSFLEAVKSGLTKYVGFSGRARRSEYWWFTLFCNIVSTGVMFGLMLIAVLTNLPAGGDTADATATGLGDAMVFVMGAAYLVMLLFFLPMLAVSVRRLHDVNRSGWFYLVNFIPFAGAIILLVVMCEDSTRGPNRYGLSPKYV